MAAQVMVKHHQDIPELHADEILEALEKNAAWQQQLFGEGACPNVSALICQASEEVVPPDSLRNMIQFRLAHASHVSMFACAAGRFNICVLVSLLSSEHLRRQSPTVLDRDPVLETVAFHELVVFCSSFFCIEPTDAPARPVQRMQTDEVCAFGIICAPTEDSEYVRRMSRMTRLEKVQRTLQSPQRLFCVEGLRGLAK